MLTDEEVLEGIRSKGRMIRAMAQIQGLLINEALARGIDKKTVLEAQRTNPNMTPTRRAKSRNRH